jgi:rubrerythrin
MKKEAKDALKVLDEAKCLEQEGQSFYRKAAERTTSKKGREMFLSLVKDEIMHERLIQRQIDALAAAGNWVELPQAQGVQCDLSQPIFPQGREGLNRAVKADTTESEALIVALEMENKSYDLYRHAAETARDPSARQMYEFLASQERVHFDLLMANYESMVQLGGWAD